VPARSVTCSPKALAGDGWVPRLSSGPATAQFVPPILGLRDGILYTMFPGGQDSALLLWIATHGSSPLHLRCCAGAELSLGTDPTPIWPARVVTGLRDIGERSKSCLQLTDCGSFEASSNSKGTVASKVPDAHADDSRMSPQEWVVADSRLLKTDFEHHGERTSLA